VDNALQAAAVVHLMLVLGLTVLSLLLVMLVAPAVTELLVLILAAQ
jgi:hypothetical protein